MFYSKSPSLSHLRVIGCLGYVTVLPKSDKFGERAVPAILIGYSELQKGYIMLDLRSNKLSVSRDVHFEEDVFPFTTTLPQTELFTSFAGSLLF